MKAVGGVKKSVGVGFIDGEQKFGDKVKFPNTAKQTYPCNKIPNPGEDMDDEAYYGRIILFPFDKIIPVNEQDVDLINKITTPGELSGWLNWAIEGYKRLIKQNGFSNDLESEETKFLMIKGGNSLAEFSSEVLNDSAGEKITKDELYKIYCKWCLEHKPKLSPDSKEKIGKNLIKFNPYIQASKSGSERYWLNLSLKDTWDTFLKNMSGFKEKDNILLFDLKNNKNDENKNKDKKINDCKNDSYIIPKSVPSAQKLKDPIDEILEDFNKKSSHSPLEKNIKPKSDRQVQFWEAEECKDIVPNHTKEDILKYWKENPKTNYKIMYHKFGVGSIKFWNELKQEGLI